MLFRSEYKNAMELSDSSAYQAWIDSGGELPFPGGESRASFSARVVGAFDALMEAHGDAKSIAIVAHGGTLMAILEKYAVPHRSYFDWRVGNGDAVIGEWDAGVIKVL